MNKKPWLDELGNPLSEKEIEKASRFWGIEEWALFQEKGMGTMNWGGDLLKTANDIEEVFSDEVSLWDFIGGEVPPKVLKKLPALKKAIQKLSGREYRVLKYYYLERMKDREIATILREKPKTVHARRQRAVKKLKMALKQDAISSEIHIIT